MPDSNFTDNNPPEEIIKSSGVSVNSPNTNNTNENNNFNNILEIVNKQDKLISELNTAVKHNQSDINNLVDATVSICDDVNRIKAVISEINNKPTLSEDNLNSNIGDTLLQDPEFMKKLTQAIVVMIPQVVSVDKDTNKEGDGESEDGEEQNKKSKEKTKSNSAINDKVYNINVKSFSSKANAQLINNLKQALKIKKQQDTFISKSNIIKLAILAFTGMLVYLFFKIKEIREAFSSWIDGIKQRFTSIKDTFVNFCKKMMEHASNIFIQPITKTWNAISTSVSEFFSDIKKRFPVIGNVINTVTDGLKKAFTAITGWTFEDLMAIFSKAWVALKKSVNSFLGFNVFTIEPEEPDKPVKDETSSTSKDSQSSAIPTPNASASPNNSQTSKESKLQPPNTGIITNNNTVNNVDQLNVHGGNINTGNNSIILQNGNKINLNKEDDIYIANKPNGVIHSIFQEINSNYTNVKTIFERQFASLIEEISEQDILFTDLISRINANLNEEETSTIIPRLNVIENRINKLELPDNPITYTGVSRMRERVRKLL